MNKVRAKKHLGQHFLNDEQIASDIVDALSMTDHYDMVLEIGPGMGVLTKFLAQKTGYKTFPIDIDKESIAYLKQNYPELKDQILFADFLKLDLNTIAQEKPFAVIGNFPYNISTQILFKVLEYKDQIPEVVGMFQKEVAERVAAQPGNKIYGITSVLLQAFYDIEYLFTVDEDVFTPPPKVKSAVIRLKRNNVKQLGCNELHFKSYVKMAFNLRRKTLRNSLKSVLPDSLKNSEMMSLRPEQLSVEQFIELTNLIDQS